MTNSSWAIRVGNIFSTAPRTKSGKTVWIDRREDHKRLAAAMRRPASHVCLDGPTGVGKTSLMQTLIVEERLKHVPVLMTEYLDWIGFCRALIGARQNYESSIAGQMEAGFVGFKPSAKFTISLADKGRELDHVSLAEKLSTVWTEHDVARELLSKNAVLIIDDMERARDNEKMLSRIADLCKILTQPARESNAKVILVGSDDIFSRLYKRNSSLDERITEVTLGSFSHRVADAVALLSEGFKQLGLFHPWSSLIERERTRASSCSQRIWSATGGLPKSLHTLGYNIAIDGEGRSGITISDIEHQCKLMIDDHLLRYSQMFPSVISAIKNHHCAGSILKYIYDKGITQPHKLIDILEAIKGSEKNSLLKGSFDDALKRLTDIDFLVRTGRSGEFIFAKHPSAAHTLGVAAREPKLLARLPIESSSFSDAKQLDMFFKESQSQTT